MSRSAQSPKARGRLAALDLSARARRARRRRGADGRRHPGQERRVAGFRRRSALRRRRHQLPRPGALRRRRARRATSRAAPRGLPHVEIERETPERHGRGRARARRDRPARLRLRPRRCGGGDRRPRRIGSKARFASAARSISISKARSRSPIPGEDGDIHVYSSTQHPTEVQHVVARVLAIPDAYVTCETRRMGGGFGGKESQATQWAAHRGARGARDRPAVQAAPRSRRRFHPHRQAARFPQRLAGRLRRRGAHRAAMSVEHLARCGYSADLSQRRRRPHDVPFRQRLFAACGRISARSGSRPTPCRTPPFAASAGRKACSSSST